MARAVARALALSNFPETVVPDVLAAAGLDPDVVLSSSGEMRDDRHAAGARRRDAGWRSAVLQAWDRQCAFCGCDGQLVGASAGIDAAHVRWFAFDGPDDLDNGLALCVLHHKLFDLGVLGLARAGIGHVHRAYVGRPGGLRVARTVTDAAAWHCHAVGRTPHLARTRSRQGPVTGSLIPSGLQPAGGLAALPSRTHLPPSARPSR